MIYEIAGGGILLSVLIGVAMWIIFEKADKPGWAIFIPVYNIYIVLEITDKPWWWLFLLLIPPINIVIGIIEEVSLAYKFGKGSLFAAGIVLLPFVFLPLLAFGDAKYKGEVPLNAFITELS